MKIRFENILEETVSRNIAKQTFLETLQDNLIEMDILTSSRHDGAYNDGPAFNLKKPYKYCNWKCAALSAIVISVTLVILLAYFIGAKQCPGSPSKHFDTFVFNDEPKLSWLKLSQGNLWASHYNKGIEVVDGACPEMFNRAMHLFGLNWHLQPMEGQMYEITEDTASSWPVPTDVSLYPSGGTGLELPDRKGKGTSEGKPSSFFPDDSFIDSGEIDVGRRATQKIPPGSFWRSQVFIDHPVHLKFNVSLGKAALVGIYGRKGLPPSHTQFDFVELLDGRRLLTQEARSLEGPQRQHRAFMPLASHETGFIQYLDSGIWHLAFYNDGKESEVVSFLTTAIEKKQTHSKAAINPSPNRGIGVESQLSAILT
ncbi:teneurin-4-like protein [Turdus rufiventris]|nr:teneurin-4-like protein [Turdus rufiventris]